MSVAATVEVVGVRALAVAAAGGLALVACASGPTTLSADDLAEEVAPVAAEAIGIDPDRMSCGDELVVEVGETATCEADLGEVGAVAVDVEVLDEDGTLAVRPQAAVVDRADAAEDLEELLASRFERSFEADCGDDGPEVVEPDQSFVCRAADDVDDRRSVRVTVTDPAGTLAFEVLDET